MKERGSEVESPIKSMVVCIVRKSAMRPLRCPNKVSGIELWVTGALWVGLLVWPVPRKQLLKLTGQGGSRVLGARPKIMDHVCCVPVGLHPSAGFLPQGSQRSQPVHPDTSNEIPRPCQWASIRRSRVQREHFP